MSKSFFNAIFHFFNGVIQAHFKTGTELRILKDSHRFWLGILVTMVTFLKGSFVTGEYASGGGLQQHGGCDGWEEGQRSPVPLGCGRR